MTQRHKSPLVLIVEDDLDTRVMFRNALNEAGFRTVDAHNGYQALEKARELVPDVVLTDVGVPGMDGFELCRAIREVPSLKRIPIVAVTGRSEYLADDSRFHEVGIADVLAKPCLPDDIIKVLRRTLGDAVPDEGSSSGISPD